MKQEELLKKIYYDPLQGFIGANKLYKKVKIIDKSITQAFVKKWLANQDVNQVHKTKRNERKKFLPIFSFTPLSFQIDLTFLPKYKKVNRGFEVIMTCIDINTRKAYAYKSKKKDTSSIMEIMNKFIADAKPNIITSDSGSEFLNKKVKSLFTKHKIEHFIASPGDKHKMSVVESFNRTVKRRLSRISTSRGDARWYDVLDLVIDNYNNTEHSFIKQTPNSVTKEDEDRIVANAFMKSEDIKQNLISGLKVGTTVRIQNSKQKFDKEGANFSSGTYTIDSVVGNTYKVKDVDGDILKKKYKLSEVLVIDKGGIVNRKKIDETEKAQKVERILKHKEQLDPKNILPRRSSRIKNINGIKR